MGEGSTLKPRRGAPVAVVAITIAAIAAVVLGENMAKLCGLMLILWGVMLALHDR